MNLRRSLKHLQLTSRSFTTLDPDQSEETAQPALRRSQSHLDRPTHTLDQLHIQTFSTTRPAPIGRTPPSVDQSDEASQTDISMVDGETILSAKGLQPSQTYSSSIYIDSLSPSVKVPLDQDTEVMIILEGLDRDAGLQSASKSVPPATSSPRKGDSRRFLSTVEMVSSVSSDGRMTLTPVASRSVEVKRGEPTVGRSPDVSEESLSQQRQMFGVRDRDHLDSVFDSVSLLLCDSHIVAVSFSRETLFFV